MTYIRFFSESTESFKIDAENGQLTYTGEDGKYGCYALTVVVRNEAVLQNGDDWYQQVSFTDFRNRSRYLFEQVIFIESLKSHLNVYYKLSFL